MGKDLKANLISDKIIRVLKKFMIFDRLRPEEIKQLLRVEDDAKKDYRNRIAKLRYYQSGESVIREGDFDCWTFWVVKGTYHVIQEGKTVVTFTKPGEIFGEMSVLEGIPRTASVVCKSGGVCLCIDMSVVENMENVRIREMIREGFYNVILSRLELTKDKMMAEKHRLEMKYADILSFEKKIRAKAGKPD